MIWRPLYIFLAVTALVTVESTCWAQDKIGAEESYPIVFNNGNDLKKLGIALWNYGKVPIGNGFPNKCYYYGDGHNSIEVSNDYLTRNAARGFSLNSLCLALQSPISFDPETGDRLPSYIVADTQQLKKNYEFAKREGLLKKGEKFDAEAGVLSETLPLYVPNCFKRGLPYHDCNFVYDVRDGHKLSKREREEIATERARVSQLAKLSLEVFKKECTCSDLRDSTRPRTCRIEIKPECKGAGSEAEVDNSLIPELGWEVLTLASEGKPAAFDSISLIDISPKLPLGCQSARNLDPISACNVDPLRT